MFTNGIDIANRALQYVGATRIYSFLDNSKQAAETGFTYPLIRQAELRRSVWRCAIKRSVIRPLTAGTARFVAPAWTLGTTYEAGRIVQDTEGTYWICMVQNVANVADAPGIYTPGQPQYWQQWFGSVYGDLYSNAVTYYAGELVYDGSNHWYISRLNTNLNHALNVTTYWQPLTDSLLFGFDFFIPAGPGVTVNGKARNVYLLPLYYLRVTSQDPKVGSTATNVVSGGLRFNDWEFESNYFISASSDPVIFRYVADVADVTQLDPLFCEALAARIAYSICEPLTQSNIKLQAIAAAYQKFVHDARLVNLIETGSTEPEEDAYSLTRGPAGVVDSVPSGGNQNASSPEGQ